MKAFCAYCGKKISKRPSVIEKQDNVFCNRTCAGKYIALHKPKDGHKDFSTYNKLKIFAELYQTKKEEEKC